MGLVEVLQDDGDVHVDDDHEVDDDERHKEDDGDKGEAAVSIRKVFVVRITVWWLGHQRVQHVIPARGGHESETNISLRTGRMFCPIIGRKQKNTETIIALGFLQFAP